MCQAPYMRGRPMIISGSQERMKIASTTVAT